MMAWSRNVNPRTGNVISIGSGGSPFQYRSPKCGWKRNDELAPGDHTIPGVVLNPGSPVYTAGIVGTFHGLETLFFTNPECSGLDILPASEVECGLCTFVREVCPLTTRAVDGFAAF